jgi:hypothetical protein
LEMAQDSIKKSHLEFVNHPNFKAFPEYA